MKRVVTGPRAVAEALRAGGASVHVVYVRSADSETARLARSFDVRCEARSVAELDALSRGLRHQGALAITGEYPYRDVADVLAVPGPQPLWVALDQVSDPRNFGAIIRTAVAFGCDGLLTLKRRASPVTAAVVRTSAGASEHARIARVTNLAHTLELARARGIQVIGLSGDGPATLDALQYPHEGRILVVGSEGKGLRRLVRERCDALARIPTRGPLGALNASVAAAIAIHQSDRQRAR